MTNKIKFLYLDDMVVRHEGYKALHGEQYNITHVWTYLQAILAMKEAQAKNEPFDVISLDHDLGDLQQGSKVIEVNSENFKLTYSPDYTMDGGIYGNQKKYYDGRDVCWWMKNNNIKVNRHVIIHSWNPDGAKEMEQILTDAGIKCGQKPYRAR